MQLDSAKFSLIRSKSVEQMMEHVMERHYHFDLTYITERIISVFFLPDLEEQQYCRNLQEVASMLKSKHQDKFLVSHETKEMSRIFSSNHKWIIVTVYFADQTDLADFVHQTLRVCHWYEWSNGRFCFQKCIFCSFCCLHVKIDLWHLFICLLFSFPAPKFIGKETWHHQTFPKGTFIYICLWSWHITRCFGYREPQRGTKRNNLCLLSILKVRTRAELKLEI